MNINELENLRVLMVESKKNFDINANKFSSENFGCNVGDIIDVTGTSYRDKKMKVTSFNLKYDNWRQEYIAVAHGIVLKANGEESKNTAISEVNLGKANI